jgi:hypothetical protein
MRGGHPLCVDCNLKFEQAFQMQNEAMMQQINFLMDQADAVTGIYGVTPRYKIPKPVIHQGPMNFHSIKIDRSVVGAVNTGTVEKMEVALNNIHAQNQNPELEQHLKDFTEAVLREAKLSAEAKNEIVEQLSVLAAQIAMPAESRIKVVMKALVTSIAANILSTGLVEHWNKIKHLLGFWEPEPMLEQRVCDHCKNAEAPLTEANGQEIFQRDSEGKKLVRAVVHRTCAEVWALAHSGTLILDVQP